MNRSDTDRGAQVNIAIWVCIIASGFAVLSKVVTKLVRHKTHIKFHNLEVDDAFVGLAFAFALVQTIVVSQQVSRGLSRDRNEASASESAIEEKLYFSSQCFYLLALSAAKVAGFCFALNLRPATQFFNILRGGLLLSILWSIASIFAVIFQCRLPALWRVYSGQCVNQAVLWASIEAIGTFLDAILGVILCGILLVLQMSRTKYILMVVFAARLIIIVPIAFRLHYIFGEQRHYPSPSIDDRQLVAITTAIAMNTSILMTCVPFLKVLMEHLQQGWTTSDVRRGIGFTATYGKTSSSSSTQFPSGSVLSRPSDRSSLSETGRMGDKEGETRPVASLSELTFITQAIPESDTFEMRDDWTPFEQGQREP